MRHLLGLLIAAVLSASIPQPARAQSTPAVFTTSVLANGLRVVVVEDHAAAVVQTGIWYRFGSLNETRGKTGLAHALEHMMFRGTPDLSEGGLDDISARLGAQTNANTAGDYTHFYFVLPADKLDLALRVEADRMQHLLLRESDWKIEKGAVLGEFDTDFSQPFTKLYFTVRKAAFPDSPHALTALGERADVVASRASDLRRYYSAWYAPNNATLVITGDVNAAAALAAATRWFGAIPARPLPALTDSAPRPARDRQIDVRADYPFEVVDAAYAIPGDLQSGAAAVSVLTSVINNQRSEFYKTLVESGLTLGYGAETDTELRAGILHVIMVVNAGHSAAQVRDAWRATLAKLIGGGFPDELVAAAKTQVAAQAVYARDSIEGLGDRYGYAIGVEGRKDPAEDDALVAAVTTADVNAAAKTYLSTPAVLAHLIPQSAKAGKSGKTGSSASGVSDDFSSRAPSGPIVEAPWVKAALAKPSELHSRVEPAAFTLSNGVRVLVQRVPANPTVFVRGTIETSARSIPAGKEGLSGMATDLLGYGSEHFDFEAQRKITDDLGASVSFGQTFDAHGMAKDLPLLLALIADAEQHPSFPDRYVALVRSQILSGIARRGKNPDYLAGRAFAKLLFPPGDPSLREATLSSVKAITKSDIAAYVAANYRPERTTIAVVGDVSAESVKAEMEKVFGGWQAVGPAPDVSKPPIPLPKAAVARVPAARSVVSVRLGQPLPSRRSPDFYAINLLNQILGGGGTFDTRLMSEIREKRGLVYGVASSIDVDKYRGTLEFTLSAAPANVRPAVAILKAQLARLQTQAPSQDELDRARSKLVGGALVGEEATAAITGDVLNIGANDLPADYYRNLAQRYQSVTPAEILRVAKRYLKPHNLVEVYEGPRI